MEYMTGKEAKEEEEEKKKKSKLCKGSKEVEECGSWNRAGNVLQKDL